MPNQNSDNLFCDQKRVFALCDCQTEIGMIRKMIVWVEGAIMEREPANAWSHESICHMFAKSVIDYIKAAFDNMQLGHFLAVNMIFRTIVENNICLDIMQRYQEHSLWKYYLVQQYVASMKSGGHEMTKDERDFITGIFGENEIDKIFFTKSAKKNSSKPFAYIDKDYGWTYKINQNFTFRGLCNLVDDREYKEFKAMSMYSHGTAFYLKLDSFTSIDQIISMISFFYYSLNRLVLLYCTDNIDDSFFTVSDQLEKRIMKFLG